MVSYAICAALIYYHVVRTVLTQIYAKVGELDENAIYGFDHRARAREIDDAFHREKENESERGNIRRLEMKQRINTR